jgi:hypothetical protein
MVKGKHGGAPFKAAPRRGEERGGEREKTWTKETREFWVKFGKASNFA